MRGDSPGDDDSQGRGEGILGYGQVEGGRGQGQSHHGVGGRHPELLGPLGLELDNNGHPRSLPLDDVLQGLAQVHHEAPHQHQLPANAGINIPKPETKKEGTERLLP